MPMKIFIYKLSIFIAIKKTYGCQKKENQKKATSKINTPRKEDIVAQCINDIIDCMIKI